MGIDRANAGAITSVRRQDARRFVGLGGLELRRDRLDGRAAPGRSSPGNRQRRGVIRFRCPRGFDSVATTSMSRALLPASS